MLVVVVQVDQVKI
jgi:hypothetical protein